MKQMLRLPKLFGDGCVLQQGIQTRIWGWDEPGQTVRILFYDMDGTQDHEREEREIMQMQEVAADADGRFETVFSGLKAGGPYELFVSDQRGRTVQVRDVYVGDVFVCGGQSNMELPMRRVRERFPEEFWNGGAPGVHVYKVQEYYDFHTPLSDHVAAGWSDCSAENLSEISAFSYFMGKELAELRKVPIGILNLSLGGTPVEAWMSREGLEEWPEYLELRRIYQDDGFRRDLMARKEKEESDWYEEIMRQESAKEEETAWTPISLPGRLSDAGLQDFCGCLWLRRTFEVSGDCAGRAGLLRFGTLTDSDHIYINGELVGETAYCYPPRRYPIPEGLLREGSNEIRIRLICRNGGGRATEGKPYEIVWEDVCSDDCRRTTGSEEVVPDSIVLAGQWEYQVRALCGPAPEQEFINRRPTGLFQGMVAPCLPYSVSAAVWYQGESNDCRPENYGELLQGMICDWRNQWEQEELPFVIVQLPNCHVDIAPGDAWPLIREAQRQAEKLDQVAVTVNLDIGEDNDLHPLDKKTAAHRAVLALRSMVCKENLVWKGPEVSGQSVEGSRVCLSFQTWDKGGLVLAERDRESGVLIAAENTGREIAARLFELAGADLVYYPAAASVCGREITIQSAQVAQPHYVRYAWSQAPGRIFLYNESGLCASPFCMELSGMHSGMPNVP